MSSIGNAFSMYKHFINTLVIAHQHEVTGQITDAATGELMAGVNVVVEGTLTGTN
jgi:hypothetical protein